MKVVTNKFKNTNILFNGEEICFNEEGISNELEDGLARELASLKFYELLKEDKKEASKKVEETEEETEEETKEEVKEVKKRATTKRQAK